MAGKLDCKTYNWRFKTTEVMSKETYLFNIFLASQFVRKFQNDHLLHYRYSVLVSGVPRNFFRGGLTNSVEDRENRDLKLFKNIY